MAGASLGGNTTDMAGGASLGGNTLTDIGTILSNYSKGSAAGRAREAELQNSQDRNALSLFNSLQGAAKDNANYRLQAPTRFAQQGVRGDLIANGKDATFSGLPSYLHVPTTDGGLRPSLLSADTRQMGTNLTREAMLAQMQGEGTNFALPGAPTAPKLTPLPEAGLLDHLAAAGGVGSSILGSLLGGGGPGSGGSGNLSQLAKDLANLFHHGNNGDNSGNDPGQNASSSRGHFDEQGNWVEDPPDYSSEGYFDPYGNWQTGPDPEGGSGPVDPSQLPGQNDPNAEYLAWLLQQHGQEGGSGNDQNPDGSGWGGE